MLRLQAAVLPVIIFATIMTLVLRLVHRRLASHDAPPAFPVGSCVLISVSAWAMGILALLTVLQLPGGVGPVQYAAGSSVAMFVFCLRVGTILAMSGVPIVAGLMGIARMLATGSSIHPDWFAAGIGSYFVAWIVLFANLWFWPTV